ncbi:MAG TPA: LysM peptidoglycan-binding domain-containing protein [Anaeromyxobacteraceae bacterium]|nr:LysM peptidoglycan-binding domain-containing protein [Anaeromyxobacteraceae bacterium]
MKSALPTILSLPLLLLAPATFADPSARSARSAAANAATGAIPPREVPAFEAVPMDAPPVELESSALSPEELDAAYLAAEGDAPDEPEIAEEIEKDSAELEAVLEAEEATHVRDASAADAEAAEAAARLGLESPLRDRVNGALAREVEPPAGGARIALLPELHLDLPTLQSRYDIPIEVNEAVLAYVRFFQSPATRRHFVKWIGRSYKYVDRFREILREHGLPQDTVYLAMIESGFGNFAHSRAAAVGAWQFISSTGRMFGLKQDFWVDERRDPEKAAHAAAKYLKLLHQQTGDWRLAWAGYNAGVGKIWRAQKAGQADFWEMAEGRILKPETKGYVPKLMAAAIIAKHPEAFGFRAEEIEPQKWTEYEEVTIPNATLLSVLANAAGVSERDLIDLNPELRRACTPPRTYQLKIPRTSSEQFAASWPKVKDKVRMTFAGHTVRRGDTLSSIARRHGVPVQGIMEMNGLKHTRKLRVGQELLIPRSVGARAVASADEDRVVARVAAAEARSSKKAKGRAVAAAERANRTTHRVRTGDTLWSISRRFGVEVGDLCRWNGIRDPHRYKLLVGKRLVVYPDRG